MTLKCSFNLSLNKINILNGGSDENTTSCFNSKPIMKTYDILHDIPIKLVRLEETSYLNFVLSNPSSFPTSSSDKFIQLITKPEYVSLTFNTFYVDPTNFKIIFRPEILPDYLYEFDFIEEDLSLITKLIEELKDTSFELGGFLTLKLLTSLEAIDYDFVDNGKFNNAILSDSN